MQKSSFKTGQAGFTLLEILLVVAAIAILAGIVIFAINPGKQLAELRNGKRRADVNLIVNALYQYSIDNNGALTGMIPPRDDTCALVTDSQVCRVSQDVQCDVDLTFLTYTQKYLVAVPTDPSVAPDASGTGYRVWINSNNRITACAPSAELGVDISVTR